MCSSFCNLALLAALAFFTLVDGTKVNKCRDSKAPQLTEQEVEISVCDGPPCLLKRKTEPSVSIKLKPEKDINEMTHQVSASIIGVPFPFIGVDGTNACPNIYSEDGKNAVGCPLKAGKTYLYKNHFKILDIYPKIPINIYWGLATNGTHVICFELSAKIV